MITRDIINKNLTVTSLRLNNNQIVKEKHNYTNVIKKINRIKNYLLNEKNAKPGDKIILANFFWPDYLAWFFACSELGIVFVVSDYPKSEVALKKLEVYGNIDYIVYDHHCPPGFVNLTDKLINSTDANNYSNDSESGIYVNNDSVFMLATSSGTTGTPKVITHTHGFFYDLLERNARLYNLKDEQKCIHSKGLHHGSVTGVYFLPTIKYCSNHYHAPFKFLPSDQNEIESIFDQSWVKMIQDEQINMCLMFYDQIEALNNYLDIENRTHDDLTIYVLSKVKPEIVNNLVGKFKYPIKSIFGCTETSGPLFLPEINVNNYTDFNPSNLGGLLDDFYDIELNDSMLEVTMPDSAKIVTGDRIEIVNGDYIFLGRENLYRIKGETLHLNLLNEVTEDILSLKRENDFDIVVDQDYQKIYIRVNTEIDLNQFNKTLGDKLGSSNYLISKQIIQPRSNFFSGIKFDPESIRIQSRL